MREMKDSGLRWASCIPEHWNVISFNNGIMRVATGLNPRDNFELDKESPFFYVTIRNFKNGKLYLDEQCDRITADAYNLIQSRAQVDQGDILFASISKDGQCYVVEEHPQNWAINESVFVLKPNPEIINSEYLYYHLIDTGYYGDLLLDATGSTFTSIKQKKLKASYLVCPPLEEQGRIASTLKEKCDKTDTLISNIQTQIEKLKVYKQSLIVEAVSKGLDSSVAMKDSGVEWIGEIPAHWEITRIKNKFALRNERNDEADLEKVNLISLYTDLGVVQHSDLTATTGNRAVTAEGYKIVHKNDIVVNIILCWMGAVGMSKYDGVTSPAYDIYRPLQGTNSEYYHYLFRTNRFNGECYRYGRGIMMMRWRTYSTEFSAINIPCPPEDEQQQIVTYLEGKCDQVDRLIAIKQEKIEKLEQYKRSLIYEYVTGKKEVV